MLPLAEVSPFPAQSWEREFIGSTSSTAFSLPAYLYILNTRLSGITAPDLFERVILE